MNVELKRLLTNKMGFPYIGENDLHKICVA